MVGVEFFFPLAPLPRAAGREEREEKKSGPRSLRRPITRSAPAGVGRAPVWVCGEGRGAAGPTLVAGVRTLWGGKGIRECCCLAVGWAGRGRGRCSPRALSPLTRTERAREGERPSSLHAARAHPSSHPTRFTTCPPPTTSPWATAGKRKTTPVRAWEERDKRERKKRGRAAAGAEPMWRPRSCVPCARARTACTPGHPARWSGSQSRRAP